MNIKSKKGFSLVELLLVVVLLGAAGVSSILVLSNASKNSKEQERSDLISRIERSAQLYVDMNESVSNELYDNKEVYVKLGLLQEENYITYSLKDPLTDDYFLSNSYIRVFIDQDGNISYQYE